jgi:RNA polymerase sigma factor (sigma-70 family)
VAAPGIAINSSPIGSLDESELALRIRGGDESACESLYRAYRAPLWRFAYSYVRSPEVAEELVQDVFLAFWRNRAEAGTRGCIRTWLYAAIRNQALNHLRHERIVTRLDERAKRWGGIEDGSGTSGAERTIAMGAPAPDAHSAIEASEVDDAVMRAIAVLSERRRVAMTLRWKHDMPASEIARVLDTTPESVRVLLTRARQDLCALLGCNDARAGGM